MSSRTVQKKIKNNVGETITKTTTQATNTILHEDFAQKISEFNLQEQTKRSKSSSPDGDGGDDSSSDGNSNNSKQKKKILRDQMIIKRRIKKEVVEMINLMDHTKPVLMTH